MNALLLQQVWSGDNGLGDYLPMVELTRKRNEEYCKRHGFDLDIVIGTPNEKYADVKKGGWQRIELIQQALVRGHEYVVWLDPDALIYDMDADLRYGCVEGIGACWHRIPQLNHWNTGVLYLQNSYAVKNFVSEWLACFPGERQWMEQGEFNRLAMKSKVVQTISDRWNATLNYSMVPDAVVLGYHGNGDANARLNMMRETLEHIPRTEG